ncbi:uncharacterized protein LY89DRAFT_88712 [Mollisia scopiformis]|uniref:Uncharacterized protein n=1 Tax=Mollisia scopiformis TaxID=149040 RepID=A0A194XA54_MOLSC|nr:uncharacterized protein LY89DRAFT_88712 [Mollisia scopiformis]KUJ16642.1 hypothetical protein LY89DRAFT_88712 [Mollisia scopiformis]
MLMLNEECDVRTSILWCVSTFLSLDVHTAKKEPRKNPQVDALSVGVSILFSWMARVLRSGLPSGFSRSVWFSFGCSVYAASIPARRNSVGIATTAATPHDLTVSKNCRWDLVSSDEDFRPRFREPHIMSQSPSYFASEREVPCRIILYTVFSTSSSTAQ